MPNYPRLRGVSGWVPWLLWLWWLVGCVSWVIPLVEMDGLFMRLVVDAKIRPSLGGRSSVMSGCLFVRVAGFDHQRWGGSWLRTNAGGVLNTCKSNGEPLRGGSVANGGVTREQPAPYSGITPGNRS